MAKKKSFIDLLAGCGYNFELIADTYKCINYDI